MRNCIEFAITKLTENDDEIIRRKKPKLSHATEKEKMLNRELHETAINHRFAVYLEQYLITAGISDYIVDIEYNKRFSDSKQVLIEGEKIPVRPDILIHKRTDISSEFPHLLVVEAKKHKTSGHDISKVVAFMNDENYLYKYGLTISYAYNPKEVRAVLYFKVDEKTCKEEITVLRKLL